jgi:hypothetical protein
MVAFMERPTVLGTIGGTVAGAVTTGLINYFIHRSDLDPKMVEISVAILRAEPKPETAPLREWAIKVINDRANVKFGEAQRAALLKNQLPTQTPRGDDGGDSRDRQTK